MLMFVANGVYGTRRRSGKQIAFPAGMSRAAPFRAGRLRNLHTRGKVMTLDSRTAASGAAYDACVVFGPKTEEIVRSLEEASRLEARVGELRGPDSASLTKFIGYLIDKHHVYARRQAAAIVALLAQLSAAHEQGQPELARVLDLFEALRRELLFHMEKEEVSLFPRIIQTEAAATRDEP